MKTACQQCPGMCAADPACSDKHCPGHPCQHSIAAEALRERARSDAWADLTVYLLCAIAALLCFGAML